MNVLFAKANNQGLRGDTPRLDRVRPGAAISAIAIILASSVSGCAPVATEQTAAVHAAALPTQVAPVKIPHAPAGAPAEAPGKGKGKSATPTTAPTTAPVPPSVRTAKTPKVTEVRTSEWKKVKDGQEVAADAKAARTLPERAAPVPLSDSVPAGPQARMKISAIHLTEGVADGIGEVAGDAVLVEITIDNKSASTLDLSRAQLLALVGKDLQPVAALSDPRSSALEPRVAPGDSTQATFIFSVPSAKPGKITIEFNSGLDSEIQRLVGKV